MATTAPSYVKTRPVFAPPTGKRSDSRDDLERSILALETRREVWARMAVKQRIAIIDEVSQDMTKLASRWVEACVRAKGIQPGSYGEGEEWLYFGIVMRLLRLIRQSLVDIERSGRPMLPAPLRKRPDGQVVAPVFPQTIWDRLTNPQVTAEVWMQRGISAEAVTATQAAAYRSDANGRIALVLGAGNASMLVVADCLYKLFVEGQVVVLKPNPVNDYLGPLVEEGLAALVKRDFLRVVYGEAETGARLCNHSLVDEIHLTGSARTFEAIVFGAGADGARRKAERRPLLRKRFTAELGNVTPVIVVPGPWKPHEIQDQADQVAAWMVNNAGFNCLTPRMIVQHASWPCRQPFLQALKKALSHLEPRCAYYPGAQERMKQYLAAHPSAWQSGPVNEKHLPWTLITDVDPQATSEICFDEEAFCSLSAETGISAPNTVEFIDRSVAFANQRLWGSLTASIIVHPRSLKNSQVAAAVDRAIANLRYGMVLVNQFGGYGYYLGVPTWGAFPGHDRHDVQSGIGVVNNTLMFAHPEKSVVRAPFRKKPDPISIRSQRFHEFGRRLAAFEARPSVWKLPGLFRTILRS